MADLKDLIELKTSLDADEVRELHRLSAQNAILLEALKFWVDVAEIEFGVENGELGGDGVKHLRPKHRETLSVIANATT